jgi:hypothetical protein
MGRLRSLTRPWAGRIAVDIHSEWIRFAYFAGGHDTWVGRSLVRLASAAVSSLHVLSRLTRRQPDDRRPQFPNLPWSWIRPQSSGGEMALGWSYVCKVGHLLSYTESTRWPRRRAAAGSMANRGSIGYGRTTGTIRGPPPR